MIEQKEYTVNGVTNLEFHHVSVLLDETIEAIITNRQGIYVDCTLGGGGHGQKLVQQLDSKGWYIGIDQDPAALAAGEKILEPAACKVSLIHSNFSQIEQILADLELNEVDGFLFDLGVSSHQLDSAERGFSYQKDARLDMRMNPESALSAFEVVNSYREAELSRIIRDYGEEKWAKRIAQFIVKERTEQLIETTSQLVEVIKKAIPAGARREGPHPAKRTFQAIRIEVNNELNILKDTFEKAVQHLKPGGRICIITFHSLEDRIAKQTLQALAKGCICPPDLPICVCHHHPQVKVLGKPKEPTMVERMTNPRARSAKLRVAEKR